MSVVFLAEVGGYRCVRGAGGCEFLGVRRLGMGGSVGLILDSKFGWRGMRGNKGLRRVYYVEIVFVRFERFWLVFGKGKRVCILIEGFKEFDY